MASGNDDSQLYQDLQGFLMSDRVDVRKAATEAILQIQHQEVHRHKLFEFDNGLLLQALIRNASYDEESTSSPLEAASIPANALQALVYLSSHGTTANQCIDVLLDSNMIARALEIVLSPVPSAKVTAPLQELWRSKVNYAMALIANLTRMEQGAVDMVGRTLPEEAVSAADLSADAMKVKPTMELLLDRYLNEAFVHDWPGSNSQDNDKTDGGDEAVEEELTVAKVDSKPYDPYQHFSAVLMNTTQVEQGRNFLLKLHYTTDQEEGSTYFQRLLPQIKSANPVRRQGTAGTIRNVCLDKDSSYWLLNVVELSKYILYPLAGPEELDVDEKRGLHPDLWLEGPDKTREIDSTTRMYLVESILLLCSTGRRSRERLRLDRTYVILKWADMVEESEQVSECINECVQYLRRDEEGTEEGSSDAFVANAYKRIMAESTASKQVRGGGGDEEDGDYDEVD
eukprot:CAMPEP_0172454360 /NCGR_PEP_ID=MMETSP1065-20121228/11377_1 /TAXON_ID=265537 /ORGANISM="Amphiprora paludosa, Strain CCMP125" /LENGTH=455 /DNA_ID=CAMNT_0013206677 /DNA_START=59 /DNA_END=1426 /DNA_ORIENTATION=+